jgi:hypothetical protein
MTVKSSSPRYYPEVKNVRRQLALLWPLVVIFIITFTYALGLRHPIFRTIMLLMSLCSPLVIAFVVAYSFSATIRKLNYYQIDSTGVHVTILGVIRKHIYWSDIGSIGPATIGDIEAIGIMYTSIFDRRVWGRKTRRKAWGWDEVLAYGHTENGASFSSDIARHFKKYLGSVGKEVAEPELEEAAIEAVVEPKAKSKKGLHLALLALPAGIIAWDMFWSLGVGESLLSLGIAWSTIRLYEIGSGHQPSRSATKWLMVIIILGAVLNFLSGMCLDAQAAYMDINHVSSIETFSSANFWVFFVSHLTHGDLWSYYAYRIIISLSFAVLGMHSIINNLLIINQPKS